MFDELKYIELSGKKYPIKCSLLVLEKIQEAYDSIGIFENGLMTVEPVLDETGNRIKDDCGKIQVRGKFPDLKCVNDALYWMLNEGEAIAAEKEHRQADFFTREKAVRLVDRMIIPLANELHDELYRCIVPKKQDDSEPEEDDGRAG